MQSSLILIIEDMMTKASSSIQKKSVGTNAKHMKYCKHGSNCIPKDNCAYKHNKTSETDHTTDKTIKNNIIKDVQLNTVPWWKCVLRNKQSHLQKLLQIE